MNKLCAFILTAFCLCMVGLNTGCVTAPDDSPEVKKWKTLKQVQIHVAAAMTVYAEAAVQGAVSESDQAKVDAFYDQKFAPAYEAAVKLARFDLESTPPDDVAVLATELILLIQQLLN